MKCLETFKNCKEVKHSMIMIIAIIYIFLSYVIFHKRLEITFRKSSTSSPLKKSSPTLFANIENFSAPPPPPNSAERGGEDTGPTDVNHSAISNSTRRSTGAS